MNDTPQRHPLNDFADRWKMDGDYIRCRHCNRPQIVSWMNEDFRHASFCKNENGESSPWKKLIALLAAESELAGQTDAQVRPTRRLLTSMQRKGGERVRAKLAGKNVRIWSDEHGAWWRPERAGYTTRIEAAGIYTAEDAWRATHHCGPEKKIAFEVIANG